MSLTPRTPDSLPRIPDYQADLNLHRSGEGHATLMALLHIVLGFAQSIGNILQRSGFTEILDWKDTPEDRFKPAIATNFRSNVSLEEASIGMFLDINEVRNINDILDLGKVLAQQMVIGNRVGHTFSFGEYQKERLATDN